MSRTTLQKIEAGEMTPGIGLVFEVASLVGVSLFELDDQRLATSIDVTQAKIALHQNGSECKQRSTMMIFSKNTQL